MSLFTSFESAKLRALHAYVLMCIACLLTCQHVLRAYVPMCHCSMCAYVLTCQRALHAYVLTCQRALHAYMFTCERVLHAYVLTCQHALHAFHVYVPTCSCAITTNNKNSFSILCFFYIFVIVLSFSCEIKFIHSCIAPTRRKPLTEADRL